MVLNSKQIYFLLRDRYGTTDLVLFQTDKPAVNFIFLLIRFVVVRLTIFFFTYFYFSSSILNHFY